MVGSLTFKERGDVALRDVVMGMAGWVGLRLEGLRGLFQPSRSHDSMIL